MLELSNDNDVSLYITIADEPDIPVVDAQFQNIVNRLKKQYDLPITPAADESRPLSPYKTIHDFLSALERTLWRASVAAAGKTIDTHFWAVLLFI